MTCTVHPNFTNKTILMYFAVWRCHILHPNFTNKTLFLCIFCSMKKSYCTIVIWDGALWFWSVIKNNYDWLVHLIFTNKTFFYAFFAVWGGGSWTKTWETLAPKQVHVYICIYTDTYIYIYISWTPLCVCVCVSWTPKHLIWWHFPPAEIYTGTSVCVCVYVCVCI